jgi:hypothetical protein
MKAKRLERFPEYKGADSRRSTLLMPSESIVNLIVLGVDEGRVARSSFSLRSHDKISFNPDCKERLRISAGHMGGQSKSGDTSPEQ